MTRAESTSGKEKIYAILPVDNYISGKVCYFISS
jgi:hypothetical protein